jgi:hypothetical protein
MMERAIYLAGEWNRWKGPNLDDDDNDDDDRGELLTILNY